MELKPMTDRARFLATMHYQPRDRAPMCDFGFWDETIPEWRAQGVPESVWWTQSDGSVTNSWFGMDTYATGWMPDVGLCPAFEEEVLEDRGDHELFRQANGVVVVRKKWLGSIPHHVGHLLTDRASWERHYKPRLDASNPERMPQPWSDLVKEYVNPQRTEPLSFYAGGLFGPLRDWMGMENVVLVPYDDPAWFQEMVETLADVAIGVLERVVATGIRLDSCGLWEDMCYSGGPLLSPAHFKEFLVPHYRRLTDALRKHGVDIVWVDCDGKIEALAPHWLDAGVNCMFPMEVGTWHADPVKFRKEYGKDLLMMGGFDKHILQDTPEAIIAEVERLAPLVEEGGFIPFPDHRIPPDVPYVNHLHYLRVARRVWGKGTNLKPCPALEQGLI